jgi:3-oxoacyl-[acyl-carrier protein] reductase
MPNSQTVFITGCANGIGQHLAEVFYQKGFQVIATDLEVSKMLTQFAHWTPDRVLIEALNVSQIHDWERVFARAVERFGRINILINNAGVVIPGYVAEFDWREIDQQVDVNIKGVMYGSQYAIKHMLAQGGGHLINFASLAGIAPIMGLPIYSATKHAVRAFSLAAYQEVKGQGIQVSVICPDLVQTNMLTLQIDYPAAALSFSSSKVLTVHDIEKAIFERALLRKQVEIMVPPSRGWLGKIGNLFPTAADFLTASLFRKGAQRQQGWKGTKTA